MISFGFLIIRYLYTKPLAIIPYSTSVGSSRVMVLEFNASGIWKIFLMETGIREMVFMASRQTKRLDRVQAVFTVSSRFIEQIKYEGLKPKERQYVH
jgi:hypothetical protein